MKRLILIPLLFLSIAGFGQSTPTVFWQRFVANTSDTTTVNNGRFWLDYNTGKIRYWFGGTKHTLGGSSFTLTNGSGTTANGTAVDLGGTLTSHVDINGAYEMNIGASTPLQGFGVYVNDSGVGAELGLSVGGQAQLQTTEGGRITLDTDANVVGANIVFDAVSNINLGGPGAAPVTVSSLAGSGTRLITTNNSGVISGTATGTGVTTALGTNVGSAGSVVVNGGALGTPSSGTGTNLTGIPQSGVTNLTSDLAGKQATLVSGTNIKTINSTSILGSGDITVGGGGPTWSVPQTWTIASGNTGHLFQNSSITSGDHLTVYSTSTAGGGSGGRNLFSNLNLTGTLSVPSKLIQNIQSKTDVYDITTPWTKVVGVTGGVGAHSDTDVTAIGVFATGHDGGRNWALYSPASGGSWVHDGQTLDDRLLMGDTVFTSSGVQYDLKSTSRGFAMPRMASFFVNAIASPFEGLMAYDTDKSILSHYNGSAWLDFVSLNASGQLSVSATMPGSLPFPRLSTANISSIPSPSDGMFAYNTTQKRLSYNNGTSWVRIPQLTTADVLMLDNGNVNSPQAQFGTPSGVNGYVQIDTGSPTLSGGFEIMRAGGGRAGYIGFNPANTFNITSESSNGMGLVIPSGVFSHTGGAIRSSTLAGTADRITYANANGDITAIPSPSFSGSFLTSTSAGVISWKSVLRPSAGTTSADTAPLKFISGSLNTTAEVGAMEFLTDKLYATITTGAARKEVTLNDAALTSGTIPIATTNGRLTDSGFSSTNLASGTYTPGLTNTTNVAASTAYVTGYYRIGSSVTVYGKIDIDATLAASSATELQIALPIASNMTAEEDLGGTAISDSVASLTARIKGDATTDRASVVFKAISLTNDSYSFEFSYQVK